MVHLDVVQTILAYQYFYAKLSKCEFGMTELLYLGHVISQEWVKVHQEKIQAILDWSSQRNLTELKGFIVLCNYYQKFVKGYSNFTAPLTDLTKKGAFSWNGEAEQAFQKIKGRMSSCLVLALPDFSKRFVLECDASGEGIAVVLM